MPIPDRWPSAPSFLPAGRTERWPAGSIRRPAFPLSRCSWTPPWKSARTEILKVRRLRERRERTVKTSITKCLSIAVHAYFQTVTLRDGVIRKLFR